MNIHTERKEGATVRMFFALWPSPDLRERLCAEAIACQHAHGGRAMQANTLHMTLLFLGDVPRSRIDALIKEVDVLPAHVFTIELEQLCCWNRNRIAYMAPAMEIPQLVALSALLRDAADRAGVGYDRRAFTPHVTVVRKLEQTFEKVPVMLPGWQVDRFALVESLLQPQGARYRNLKVWLCRG